MAWATSYIYEDNANAEQLLEGQGGPQAQKGQVSFLLFPLGIYFQILSG